MKRNVWIWVAGAFAALGIGTAVAAPSATPTSPTSTTISLPGPVAPASQNEFQYPTLGLAPPAAQVYHSDSVVVHGPMLSDGDNPATVPNPPKTYFLPALAPGDGPPPGPDSIPAVTPRVIVSPDQTGPIAQPPSN